MSNFVLTNQDKAGIQTPDSGQTTIFVDLDKKLKAKLDNGTIVDYGAAGTNPILFVQYFTLDTSQVSAAQITLSHSPTTANQVILDVISGSPQIYGDDYTVSGTTLSWAGKNLASVLIVGDKLRVQYYYL
jgi:hypothetical protein